MLLVEWCCIIKNPPNVVCVCLERTSEVTVITCVTCDSHLILFDFFRRNNLDVVLIYVDVGKEAFMCFAMSATQWFVLVLFLYAIISMFNFFSRILFIAAVYIFKIVLIFINFYCQCFNILVLHVITGKVFKYLTLNNWKFYVVGNLLIYSFFYSLFYCTVILFASYIFLNFMKIFLWIIVSLNLIEVFLCACVLRNAFHKL